MAASQVGNFAPGTVVAGRYRVERLLGAGGMGAVYLAMHVELQRQVALKVLLPELARQPEVVERFFREARAAASIGHPGIVDVIDLGREGEVAYIAMERLEGEELASRAARAPRLRVREVASLAADVCDAVGAAHARGIVHRDLKPANVFVIQRGGAPAIKVLDFGIAKVGALDPEGLTKTGQVMGTPIYMSPEQIRDSARVDARTDVYAIGVILFELLTGRPPFVADTYPGLVLAICSVEAEDVRVHAPDVPAGLAELVARTLAKDREARPASAAALRTELLAFLATDQDGETAARSRSVLPPTRVGEDGDATVATPARRTPWIAAAIALAAAVVVGAALAASSGDDGELPPAALPIAALPIAAALPDAPSVDAGVTGAPDVGPPRTRLEVDVEPPGAHVEAASGETCDAPCVLLLVEAPTTLAISLAGHAPESIEVAPPFPSRIEVRLRRAARPHSAPSEPPPPLRPP